MKLVVSVMPKSLEEAQEIDVSRYEEADIIEWRADFLAKDDILNVAPAIFGSQGENQFTSGKFFKNSWRNI